MTSCEQLDEVFPPYKKKVVLLKFLLWTNPLPRPRAVESFCEERSRQYQSMKYVQVYFSYVGEMCGECLWCEKKLRDKGTNKESKWWNDKTQKTIV